MLNILPNTIYVSYDFITLSPSLPFYYVNLGFTVPRTYQKQNSAYSLLRAITG